MQGSWKRIGLSALLTGASLGGGAACGGGTAVSAADSAAPATPAPAHSVTVISAQDGAPIAAAHVLADGWTGVSGPDGVVALPDTASMSRLDVRAEGYVPAVWLAVGADTVELELQPRTRPAPATAEARGELSTGAFTADLEAGHTLLARVRTTTPTTLAGVGAGLVPDGEQEITCAASRDVCGFELTTRVGDQRLYALLYDVDPGGTDSAADDVRTLVGLAVSEPLSPGADERLSGIDLQAVPDAQLVVGDVQVRGPAGLSADVVGVPGVLLKEGSGVLLVPGGAGPSLLPQRQDAVGEAGYWMVGEARAIEPSGDAVRLLVTRRNLEPDDLVLDGGWPDVPGAATLLGNVLLLPTVADAVPAGDTALWILHLLDAAGAPLLDVVAGEVDRVQLTAALAQRVASVELSRVVARPESGTTSSLATLRAALVSSATRKTNLADTDAR